MAKTTELDLVDDGRRFNAGKLVDRPAYELARSLIASGFSNRLIATATGLARSTVSNIRLGHHTRQRKAGPVEEMPREQHLRTPIRCPTGCGGRIVVLPCRVCALRKSASR